MKSAKKGQGTFEYILLLAGVLLIVVLAIVLLRGGIFQTSQANIQKNNCVTALVQSGNCYYANGTWKPGGAVPTPDAAPCIPFASPGACTATAVPGEVNNGFCCGAKP